MSDMADGRYVQSCVVIYFLEHLSAVLTTYIIVGQSFVAGITIFFIKIRLS